MKAFMFVVAVAVFALMNTASAQVVAGDATLVILDLSSAGLTVTTGGEVDLAPVPGNTYHIFWDASNGQETIDPPDPSLGNNADIFWDVVNAGGGGINVVFTFSLPNAFTGQDTGAQIPITYGNVDAVFEDGGTNVYAWNPRMTSPPINIVAGGEGFVHLGMTFTVPFTSPTDTYEATFYLAATSTGF